VSTLRTPVVIGLHHRSGASTVATALHAHEGCEPERAADIVCVGEHALSSALALITPATGPRPILAVGAGATGSGSAPLRALGSRFGAVVVIPHLTCWAGVPPPSDEIAVLLGMAPGHLPQPLQAYAAAMRDIAAAVVGSGQLRSGTPPMVLRPRPLTFPVPAIRPIPLGRRVAPAPPVQVTAAPRRPAGPSPDLDDEALEAAGFAATRRAAG
jgi:hypothetical protein